MSCEKSEKPPLIHQKLNIPFADYGSMQYFVEKVKYRIYL